MGHSVPDIDISKPLAHMTPFKFSKITLTVEKLTSNYLATALVDIPAVSGPIAPSLKT